ncbi:MAG: hypothetical protein WBP81_35500 [Solirubrobacteraceae bacterium]
MELLTERRQSDVDDRRIEDRHDRAEHDDDGQPQDLGRQRGLRRAG